MSGQRSGCCYVRPATRSPKVRLESAVGDARHGPPGRLGRAQPRGSYPQPPFAAATTTALAAVRLRCRGRRAARGPISAAGLRRRGGPHAETSTPSDRSSRCRLHHPADTSSNAASLPRRRRHEYHRHPQPSRLAPALRQSDLLPTPAVRAPLFNRQWHHARPVCLPGTVRDAECRDSMFVTTVK